METTSPRAEVSDSLGRTFRFSSVKTFEAFGLYWGIVFSFVLLMGFILGEKNYYQPAGLAGLTFLLSGMIYLFFLGFVRKNYENPLFDFLVGIVARSGIPLLAALVFFFLLGKILFNKTAIALVIFYLLIVPFEVWISYPKGQFCKVAKIIQNKSGQE